MSLCRPVAVMCCTGIGIAAEAYISVVAVWVTVGIMSASWKGMGTSWWTAGRSAAWGITVSGIWKWSCHDLFSFDWIDFCLIIKFFCCYYRINPIKKIFNHGWTVINIFLFWKCSTADKFSFMQLLHISLQFWPDRGNWCFSDRTVRAIRQHLSEYVPS